MKSLKILVIVFTYGRLEHTKVTLESLSKNINFQNYPVIIYSDGPKQGHEERVELLRNYLRKFKKRFSNVKLIERKKNLGLEKSIIKGISDILKDKKAIIVIEDDIKTSPYFLQYMDKLLNKYQGNKNIGCITGYNTPGKKILIPGDYKYDVYFAPRTCSWGWATWSDRWDSIDWKVEDIDEFIENKKIQKRFNQGGNDLAKMLINQAKKNIDTWDVQWCYHNFKNNRYTIYPTISYVENIGMDGSGVHCGSTSGFENKNLNHSEPENLPSDVILDNKILKNFKKAQNLTLIMFIELAYYRIIEKIKSLIRV